MTENAIPELTSKVISSATVNRQSDTELVLALEFTDGTSFCFTCQTRLTSDSSLYRGGIGEPEVIRKFES